MIYELGLEQHLFGVTFECPSDKPKIVRSILEGKTLTSAEIDTMVSDYAARDETLYYLENALLEAAAPDVIFTQHVCNVCQIGTAYVERAVHKLPHVPKLVALVPRRLSDVFENARTIARELGEPARGEALVARAQTRINQVVDTLRAAHAMPKRVMVMEWLDPIYNCGHWIPDQITLAGGADAFSCPGGYSVPVTWERVQQYDPEVLIVAPCGFRVPRALEEIARLTERAGFSELQAAKAGRVFVADADLFTQPSVTGLVDGIELLAHAFHAELFALPPALTEHVARVT